MTKKGYKFSEEARKRMSLSKIGNQVNKGRKHSLDIRKKMSEAHKGKFKGINNPNWRGGTSYDGNNRIRKSFESRLWREAIFTRDGYVCQKCGQKGGIIHPHHIFSFSTYIDLRFAIDNGVTLCKECHRNFHTLFGTKNNTKEQLEVFLK